MNYSMKVLVVVLLSFFFVGCGGPDRSNELVVIDAGHGGHDSGAYSGGKKEKDLVLQITKKLYKSLKSNGYQVAFTRNTDTFLKLGQRTRIADKKDAKVFISVHANAIANKSRFNQVEGVETYFLQKTRDARSQRIASRENASVLQGTDRLSQQVIVDSVLAGPKVIHSHKLAIDVQNGMMRHLKPKYPDVKNGGAKPGPFYILVGASRPSILIEVGYLTNPKERARLFTSDYQNRIAEGIAEGVGKYLDNREQQQGF